MLIALALLLVPQEKEPERFPEFGLRVEAWYATPEGRVESDAAGVSDSGIALDDDVDAEPGVVPRIGGTIFIDERLRIDAEVWWGEWEGKNVLNGAEFFDGVAFPAGSPVEGRITAWDGSAQLRASALKNPEAAKGYLWFGAGIEAFRSELELEGVNGKGKDDADALMLTAGLDGGWKSPRGPFAGGFLQLRIDPVRFDYAAYEFGLRGGYDGGIVALEGGYRAFWFEDLKGRKPDYRLRLGGPFVGVRFRF